MSEHREEIRKQFAAYIEQVAPSFDAQATLALLRRIEPRPQEEDFALLSNEIDELDAGSLDVGDSDLLNIILPAVQGKKTFDIFTDGQQLRQRYSIPFALQLHQGTFRLVDAGRPEQKEGTSSAATTATAPAAGDSSAQSADPDEEGESGEPFAGVSPQASDSETDLDADKESEASEASDAVAGEDADSADASEPDAPVTAAGDTPSGMEPNSAEEESGEPFAGVSLQTPDSETESVAGEEPDLPDLSEAESEEDTDPADAGDLDAPEAGAYPAAAEEQDTLAADAEDGEAESVSAEEQDILAADAEDGGAEPVSAEEQDILAADAEDGEAEPVSAEEQDTLVADADDVAEDANTASDEVPGTPTPADVTPEEILDPAAEAESVASEALATDPSPEGISDPAVGEGGAQDAASDTLVDDLRQQGSAEEVEEDNTPLPDLAQVTANLIDNGKTAALHWLSSKTETDLPGWLTELLHLGLHLRPHFTEASYRTNQLLNDALRHYSNLTERQSLLFVAAIIRPMFFLPQASLMPVLSHLASRHKAYKPFLDELRNFVGLSKPLDERFITLESAQNQRARELEALHEETRHFWQRMRKVRLSFRPASEVHRALFANKGFFGQYLEACLNKEFDCLDELLAKEWTFAAKQDLVDNINRQKRSKSTKSIVASARAGLFADIDQTLGLLTRWQTYARTKDQPQESASHLNILKAIRDMDLASSPEERLLQSCLAELKRSSEEKTSLCTETIDPSVELALWPLALPFDLAAARPCAVLKAVASLLESGAASLDHADEEAVARHMMRGELVLTEAYLQAYKQADTLDRSRLVALAAEYDQELNIEENHIDLGKLYDFERRWWRNHLDACRDSCLQKISDAYFRGSILYTLEVLQFLELCDLLKLHLTIGLASSRPVYIFVFT